MKFTWEEKDLEAGIWFGFSPQESNDLSFLITRTYKLGYCQECRHRVDDKDYCMIAITDGAIYGHGTKADLVKTLNDNGYVPLKGAELMRRLDHSYTRASEKGRGT